MYIKPYTTIQAFDTLLKLDKEAVAIENQKNFLKKKCNNKRNKINKTIKRKQS
jgi:hypothetical protein